jgi:hypothetical protein
MQAIPHTKLDGRDSPPLPTTLAASDSDGGLGILKTGFANLLQALSRREKQQQ